MVTADGRKPQVKSYGPGVEAGVHPLSGGKLVVPVREAHSLVFWETKTQAETYEIVGASQAAAS